MLTMIVGGVGELLTELFVDDEEEKRALKAAMWAAAAVVGVADAILIPGAGAAGAGATAAVAVGEEAASSVAGEVAKQGVREAATEVSKAIAQCAVEEAVEQGITESVATGATMMATQGLAAAVEDEEAKGVIDTAGSVLSGGVGSWLGLGKAVGGATVGGAIGASADGDQGAIAGMSMGASVMRGSWVENGAKLAGGGVGAGVGAAVADDADRAKAAKLGFQVGVAVGGGVAGLQANTEMAAQNAELAGNSGRESLDSAVEDMKFEATVALAAEAGAPLLAAVVHEDEPGRDFLDSYATMRSVASSTASGVAHGASVLSANAPEIAEVGKALGGLGGGIGELAAFIVQTNERRAERRVSDAREGGGADERAGQRRQGIDAAAGLLQQATSRKYWKPV